MSVVEEQVGLPAGRYPARVDVVDLIEGGRKKPWQMRLGITVLRNGAQLSVERPLAKHPSDPYAVTPAQRKSLSAFAERLSVQDKGPVEEMVSSVRALAGHEVLAHLKSGPMGLVVTLHATNGHTHDDKVTAGEALDKMPDVEPDYRQRTIEAQGAHEQLVTGLNHANRGLALAAEGCWKLRQEDGWVALGYDSIGQYLAAPEVSLKRAKFYAWGDIWEFYIVQGGQDPNRLCAPSKLVIPLRALREQEVGAEEALDDALMLGLRDLREKYRGEQPEKEEKPDSMRTEFPIACTACGVVIDDEAGLMEVGGLVYQGHRWPEEWSHEQVVAAVTAAEAIR